MSYNVGQRSQWSTILYDAFVSTELISIISLQRNKTHTLLSEALISFMGLSCIDAKKQNNKGLLGKPGKL